MESSRGQSAFGRGHLSRRGLVSKWYFWLGIWFCLLWAARTQAQQNSASLEYKVKAAYLFNFAKYVEWPAQSFSRPDSPIAIGVLGEDPFGEVLEKTVEKRRINNREVVIRRSLKSESLKDCHLVFVSNSERSRLPEIFGNFPAPFALTVSDADRFLPAGGMIHFVIDEGTVRFEIDLDRVQRADLKIGSRMLSSAKSVYSKRSKLPK